MATGAQVDQEAFMIDSYTSNSETEQITNNSNRDSDKGGVKNVERASISSSMFSNGGVSINNKSSSEASSTKDDKINKHLSTSSSIYEEGTNYSSFDEEDEESGAVLLDIATENPITKAQPDIESRSSSNNSFLSDSISSSNSSTTDNTITDHTSDLSSDSEDLLNNNKEIVELKNNESKLLSDKKVDDNKTANETMEEHNNNETANETLEEHNNNKTANETSSNIFIPSNLNSAEEVSSPENISEFSIDSENLANIPMLNKEKELENDSSTSSSSYSSNSSHERASSKSSVSSVSSLQRAELKRPIAIEVIKELDEQQQLQQKEEYESKNRMSVASLGENPHLNDISLNDDIEQEEDNNSWSFSKNLQAPVKSLTSFINSFSSPSTPIAEIHEDTENHGDIMYPKTPTSGRSFTSLFSLRSGHSSTTSIPDTEMRRSSNASVISQNSNYDLLLAKIDKENEIMTSNPRARRLSLQGMEEIKKSFERVQNNIVDKEVDNIDWDFWGLIISDYESVAKSQPRQLSRMIQKGIPPALRGMIWQLMSKSKDAELESTYAQLLKETSAHEKLIMRDLNRTFPKHEYFQDQNGIGQEGLFNVVKAYSVFDKDVGYCQGISFVVGPLLLHMPDEEAFCVLVRLMTFYNMRGHFLPGMDGLQLRLFQFDRLVEEMLPRVHQHFQAQGVNSSMYASQWFMTLFAYKFPLSLVLRIYDTIFTEGIEALFRFSIALLKRNEDRLVHMEFETLLEFLKSGLYTSYQINPINPIGINNKNTNSKEIQYNTNEFVQDAYQIRITIKKLNKYQQQYLAYQETERQARSAETIAMERLRISNNQLSQHVKQLEGSLQTLNREHIDIANELINTKIELAKVKDENDTLHHTVSDLRKSLEATTPVAVENRVREDMNTLAEKNVELITRNTHLEDQLSTLENMLIEIKMRYAESENEREVLKRKWNGLKKALG
ncbi:3691_t:CDS:2 [Ambispora gerdemannii]|uniref:3691_t:CDS:1 n=1 Tax=Ambispora gerdemannii TaxID=144530 RepID=A0A9N8YJ41_9GLOM|nr:3691_t:CDS:2 [Ambispora gerdemannii]